jgi:tetratricopeptide (TPR) repeat protein
MTEERPRRVRALFDQAADLPPADRRAFLDAGCADDTDLRARVEHLLACDARLHAQEGAGGFLNSPLVRPPEKATDPGADAPSTLVKPGPPPFPSVPGYALVRELGRGGMGVVYLAQQLRLDRPVALKMPPAGLDIEEWHRFRTEAAAAARLQHPHIVQVHETGEHQGRPFLVMELLEGGSLAQKLAQAPLAARPAAEMLEKLARAVHYAHERGVIHRDLKPANVLLTADGTPKVSDFGLARRLNETLWPATQSSAARTETGAILGTPSYMAPEQAAGRGKEAGPPTDVYALGAILYECLTGRPPFKGATALETAQQVLRDDPVPPRRLQPGVPHDLETICLKCLAKEPPRRYASAAHLADDLRRQLEGRPVVARPLSPAARAWRWTRRNPRVAALTAAVLLGLLLAGGAWLWQVRAREARDREALETLDQAVSLLQQARSGGDPDKWAAARTEALRAQVLLEQGTGWPDLAEGPRALLRQIDKEEAARRQLSQDAQPEQIRLGWAHAGRREWDRAAARYTQVWRLVPTGWPMKMNEGHFWFECAAVQLLSGDRNGYRAACARMVQRCGKGPSLKAYHMARACTLAADSVQDAAQPERLAEAELKAMPRHFWALSLTEQGALRYRAGAFEEAELLQEQSLRTDGRPGAAVVSRLWLALTNQRLGKTEEARRLLDCATKWLDQSRPDFSHSDEGVPGSDEEKAGLHLHNWLEACVLRREAEALVGTVPR